MAVRKVLRQTSQLGMTSSEMDDHNADMSEIRPRSNDRRLDFGGSSALQLYQAFSAQISPVIIHPGCRQASLTRESVLQPLIGIGLSCRYTVFVNTGGN
jgi:hypothetical protein